MKERIISLQTNLDKFKVVSDLIIEDCAKIYKHNKKPILLDVGCRDCKLKQFLPEKEIKYIGLDLYQNESKTVDIVCDVTLGLPFKDNSIDYVVALDILEHIDNFKEVLFELYRIANRKLIINIPNIANLFFRLQFLFKGQISGKYKLIYNMPEDRHRWLTTQKESDEFFRVFVKEVNADLKIYHIIYGPRKILWLLKLLKNLHISPNIWVWSSLYEITKR